MRRELDLVMLQGFSLCTYEITYYLPDQRSVLAPTFVLQRYDLVPQFPELHKFLDFWRSNIEGSLHSVRVASQRLVRPAEIRIAQQFGLN